LLWSCAISQQQEVALGASSAAEVGASLPLMRDPATVRYVTELGQRLVAATDDRGLAWTFTVVDSREVNAFAIPGGWIYVNRGLIERAETMRELAGVLAHEIGHVTRRHSVQQLQQAQGADVSVALLCTLTKVCNSGLAQGAVQLGGAALFAKFSRDDETEADADAVTTTVAAGISPVGISTMFRRLLAERQSAPGVLDGFFSTHPLEESRIADADARIARYPASTLRSLEIDAPSYAAFRRRLASLPHAPAPRPPN
jgi:predicted Zn-dependent protease